MTSIRAFRALGSLSLLFGESIEGKHVEFVTDDSMELGQPKSVSIGSLIYQMVYDLRGDTFYVMLDGNEYMKVKRKEGAPNDNEK